MGRLLDELLNATYGTHAISAIPAIPVQGSRPAGNRGNAEIALGSDDATKPTEAARQVARLLQVIRDQELPDRLLALDRATPAQLAALTLDELRAYARLLDRTRIMSAGLCPCGYTQRAICGGCGPVLLWVGAPAELIACPWCARRKAGQSIPRPLVRCDDCTHFVPDPINPAGGTGVCGLALPYRSGERARQPVTSRRCPEHRPRR